MLSTSAGDAASPQSVVIRTAFEEADTDGDGVISASELIAVFRRLGTWTDEELEGLLDAGDHNGDGFIRYREFVAWIMGEWTAGGREAVTAMAALPAPSAVCAGRFSCRARLMCMRHAKPAWWDRSAHPVGAVRDPGLAEVGSAQAQRLKRRLANDVGVFDVIICSPMARVLETVAPLFQDALEAPPTRLIICNAQLCEHGSIPSDFYPDRIALQHPSFLGAKAQHEVRFVSFGTGETDTTRRAEAVATWLYEESGRWPAGAVVGIFAHQTILDCFLQVLVLGDSSAWEYGWPKFKMRKGSISEFAIGPDGVSTVKMNDCAHL
eukprot:TRINITY_DN50612_c0_g1_i1.p1 TRINITY_DN50612_c0_g1~~TRINITY_DN50612_c0_g1_i1.p1  ORF type:complete len:323 (-),score=33.82 TRINITY_DN50612_c0_g1_i1:215-1183(-)